MRKIVAEKQVEEENGGNSIGEKDRLFTRRLTEKFKKC